MRNTIIEPSNILLTVTLLLGLFVWSGCSTPQTEEKTIYDVVSAQQHPTEDVMLVEVDESVRQVSESGTGSRVGPVQRAIYQCVRDGDDLRCQRTCGVEHECPERRNIISSGRSVSAQGGMFRSRAVEADVAPESDEDGPSTQDESDESAVSTDNVEDE